VWLSRSDVPDKRVRPRRAHAANRLPLNIVADGHAAGRLEPVNRLTPERAEELAVLAAAAVAGRQRLSRDGQFGRDCTCSHGFRGRFISRDPAEQT